jgi:hypothetical protein
MKFVNSIISIKTSKMSSNNIILNCGCVVVEGSEKHLQAIVDINNQNPICEECYDDEYEDEDSDEEEELGLEYKACPTCSMRIGCHSIMESYKCGIITKEEAREATRQMYSGA